MLIREVPVAVGEFQSLGCITEEAHLPGVRCDTPQVSCIGVAWVDIT